MFITNLELIISMEAVKWTSVELVQSIDKFQKALNIVSTSQNVPKKSEGTWEAETNHMSSIALIKQMKMSWAWVYTSR